MINLKSSTKKDIDFLFNLRNNPKIREWFFDDTEVKKENHIKWFAKNHKSVYIIYNDLEKIGQISFKGGTKAFPSISILPEFQGKGYASIAISKFLPILFDLGFEKIVAEIKTGNIASENCFKRAGFKFDYQTKQYNSFVYRKEWFCKKCSFENPTPTATALIIKDNKILLLKRNQKPFKNKWDLPGGYLERGETIRECMARELKEELRTDFDLTYVKEFLGTTKLEEKIYPIISHLFLARPKGEIKLNNENSKYKWVKIREIKYIAFDSNQKIIDWAKYLEFDLKRVKELIKQLDPNSKFDEWKLYNATIDGYVRKKYDGVKLIGMGWIFPRKTMLRRQAVVEDMIVDEKYRGKGIGKEILSDLIDWAKDNDIEVIELTTNPKRIVANGLYKEMGFKLHKTNHYLYDP